MFIPALLLLLSSENTCTSHLCIRKTELQQIANPAPSKKQCRVVSNERTLSFDGREIAPILTNPKDGMQDLPDSVWSGFVIPKIVEAAKSCLSRNHDGVSFVYSSPEAFPYAYAKPILRSLGDAGARSVHIPSGIDRFVVAEIILDKTDEYVVHSADSAGTNSVLLIYRDSLQLYVHSKANDETLPTASIATKHRDRFSDAELRQLEAALVQALSKRNYLNWIGIDPHPSTPIRKIVQLLSLVQGINDRKSLPKGLNASLYGAYVPWE